VATWFSRKRKRAEVPRIRPRKDDQATTKVDLHELTPDIRAFLGQAAYVQLTIFENLGRAIATAPSTEAKSDLSRMASMSLAKHHGLVAEIVALGEVPSALMKPFTDRVDEYQRLTHGADWFETLVTCYVTAGFLDDFFSRLAAGLPRETADRVRGLLEGASGENAIVDELLAAIEENPRLASRLAMWGRRLIGDTMLLARKALAPSENQLKDEARIEPVFTELIAAHTRRMDALGLTA
jgi:hypothetical protein